MAQAGSTGQRAQREEFLMRHVLIFFLRVYKLCISPFLGNHCRFYPSCSEYAQEAIHTHGAVKGSYLAARRLSKCHPWHEGGEDPVPPCTHTH
ncbi:MAG: membrane protein insertion efficiency factor YidD [Halioglobus sp.]|nr:membrane protein insertion efficiency factor YidD [Halioglobus sp.]